MKKAVLALFLISCLLLVSSWANYEFFVKASSTTLTVDDDGPADFDSIQKAIDNARSGYTIFVHIGRYYENVVVNQSVALVGENRDLTIINGTQSGNVISIRASGASVENFTIMKSGGAPYDGIKVDHSVGNVIRNNRIIDNFDGIGLYYSSSNLIYRNNISANNNEGIYLLSSSNNAFSDNWISSNEADGIYIVSSTNNAFSRNAILDNPYGDGIYLDGSNNVIEGNNISANYIGIYAFLYSSNNTIYHNMFNNKIQAWSDPTSMNTWDYGNEGNYWSDYAGRDLNEDGIGDSPYVISGNALGNDTYPLMGAFYDFDATLDGETFRVSIISNSTISDFRFEIGTETGNKIIRFNATTKGGMVDFSRVTIPKELTEDPYIVLVGSLEVVPTPLNISDETKVCLYLTYSNGNHTITIISSRTLHLYSELLARYLELQTRFDALNETYYGLQTNNVKLQADLNSLNDTLNDSLAKYLELQKSFDALNEAYYGLLTNYGILLRNYTSLLESFDALNTSSQQHLSDYSEQAQNSRSLIYIFAATTAIFIVITVYFSKLSHERATRKMKQIVQ